MDIPLAPHTARQLAALLREPEARRQQLADALEQAAARQTAALAQAAAAAPQNADTHGGNDAASTSSSEVDSDTSESVGSSDDEADNNTQEYTAVIVHATAASLLGIAANDAQADEAVDAAGGAAAQFLHREAVPRFVAQLFERWQQQGHTYMLVPMRSATSVRGTAAVTLLFQCEPDDGTVLPPAARVEADVSSFLQGVVRDLDAHAESGADVTGRVLGTINGGVPIQGLLLPQVDVQLCTHMSRAAVVAAAEAAHETYTARFLEAIAAGAHSS